MSDPISIDQTRQGQSNDVASNAVITVYYDGECPVCRMEVQFYRRIDLTRRVDWIDIATLRDIDLPVGKNRSQLLGLFHAKINNNVWLTGVDVFGEIWSQLPRFRRFAWVFHTPVLRQIAQLFYRAFLIWQRHDRARRQRITVGRHAAPS